MSALTDFLLARIGEEQTAALAATPGPWAWTEYATADDETLTLESVTETRTVPVIWLDGYVEGLGGIAIEPADADHIVRWNPAEVLRECEAKRRIVTALHTWYGSEDAPNEVFFSDDDGWRGIGWCVQLLALPYADHPDYDPAWVSAGAR